MGNKRVMAIYKDVTNEVHEYVGDDVWLSDGIHTYYVGMNTGVVGPYGTSTDYFTYFNSLYDMYNVAEELFDCKDMYIELVSITLT